MKKILLIVGVLIVIFLIFGGDKETEVIKTTSTPPNKTALENVLKTEEKVKDFVITDANVLYISVLDDGTNRDGFASYFCQLALDHNLRLNKVVIVKYGSMNSNERDNAYGVALGEAQCN